MSSRGLVAARLIPAGACPAAPCACHPRHSVRPLTLGIVRAGHVSLPRVARALILSLDPTDLPDQEARVSHPVVVAHKRVLPLVWWMQQSGMAVIRSGVRRRYDRRERREMSVQQLGRCDHCTLLDGGRPPPYPFVAPMVSSALPGAGETVREGRGGIWGWGSHSLRHITKGRAG